MAWTSAASAIAPRSCSGGTPRRSRSRTGAWWCPAATPRCPSGARWSEPSSDSNESLLLALLETDHAKGAYLWHALRFAPRPAVEYFAARRDAQGATLLRRVFDRLDGGARVGSTAGRRVSRGSMRWCARFPSRPTRRTFRCREVRACGRGHSTAMRRPRLSRSCARCSRTCPPSHSTRRASSSTCWPTRPISRRARAGCNAWSGASTSSRGTPRSTHRRTSSWSGAAAPRSLPRSPRSTISSCARPTWRATICSPSRASIGSDLDWPREQLVIAFRGRRRVAARDDDRRARRSRPRRARAARLDRDPHSSRRCRGGRARPAPLADGPPARAAAGIRQRAGPRPARARAARSDGRAHRVAVHLDGARLRLRPHSTIDRGHGRDARLLLHPGGGSSGAHRRHAERAGEERARRESRAGEERGHHAARRPGGARGTVAGTRGAGGDRLSGTGNPQRDEIADARGAGARARAREGARGVSSRASLTPADCSRTTCGRCSPHRAIYSCSARARLAAPGS